MTRALILIDIWDKTNDICHSNSLWWEEAEKIVLENIFPVLSNARKHNWVIIHCHSELPCALPIIPIAGEYEIPYDHHIIYHIPPDILEKLSTIYFVGFALNLCITGNNCGIPRSRDMFPHKTLILLKDCTKALAMDELNEDKSFEKTLQKLSLICNISLSEDIIWDN